MTLGDLQERLIHALGTHPRKSTRRAIEVTHTQAEEQIATEADVQGAFINAVVSNFKPTRKLRAMLRRLDPRIDIKRGAWVRINA